jgi:hypothetical protein
MTDTETKPFGDYSLSPLPSYFWIKGRDLVGARDWRRESLFGPNAADRFSTSITGKAVSERESVCVIGKDRETKEFNLTIKSDDAWWKQDWEGINRNESLVRELATERSGTTPELRLSGIISKRLGKQPPTATLHAQGWSIECAVPPPVLAQLEAELLAQRASDVYIFIQWPAALYDGSSWGLFTIPEHDGPEPLRGHIERIKWRVSDRSVMPAEPMPIDGEPHQASPGSGVEEEVHRLVRACTIGFFAVLVLILIGHFIR